MKLEIRSAEGGDDSKLLVSEMEKIYKAAESRYGFRLTLLTRGYGFSTYKVEGNTNFFRGESGGHRWQRIPPTEKRGRVQTSTVTVAVLDDSIISVEFDPSKIRWETFRCGGPGGQNVNKLETGVRAYYNGLVVESRECRKQGQNKKSALEKLRRLIYDSASSASSNLQNQSRKSQIGSGQRGDKIRTYREQDDLVKDELTGAKCSLSKIRKGDWSKIK